MGREKYNRPGMEAFSCMLLRLAGGGGRKTTTGTFQKIASHRDHYTPEAYSYKNKIHSISHAACKHHLKNSQARCWTTPKACLGESHRYHDNSGLMLLLNLSCITFLKSALSTSYLRHLSDMLDSFELLCHPP